MRGTPRTSRSPENTCLPNSNQMPTPNTMRTQRPVPASWTRPFFSSWKSLVLTCLALSQVVTICLLLRIAGNGSTDGVHPLDELSCPYDRASLGPRPRSTAKFRRRVLSVVDGGATSKASAKTRAASKACVPQTISPGQCSDEERAVRRPAESQRETCAFELDESEVVFGVWHSLATEGRLQPLLETWGRRTQVVLLASSVGVRESTLFTEGVPGSRPHLLDTGVEQDDYFSTLGKAFVGLRLMLEAYPTKKWFVVLGDDNYVLLDNYVNVLSAFDPEQPLAMSRMVHRNKFGCKVAGGASVITSRAMTRELSPHLEPWYKGIVERSGGDVNKAAEEDKFHDIAFQKLVEHVGHSWVHLDELPHEPPGYYFDPRLGVPRGSSGAGGGFNTIPERSALFHYVPGKYMHYLDFVSHRACTCDELTATQTAEALSEVAVGVYSPSRRLSKLDEKRIEATWGRQGGGVPSHRRLMLAASGREHAGVRGDLARLRELSEAFPDAGWLLLLPVEHYLVAANLAARIAKLDADKSPGRRGLMVYGPPGDPAAAAAATERRRWSDAPGQREPENPEDLIGEGALLVGKDLAETIFYFGESLAGGVFPAWRLPGDRFLVEWARTLSSLTVVQDAGFVRRLPRPGTGGALASGEGVEEEEEEGAVGCPATFPMEPDLADLKPEFTMSERDAVMAVTGFLLRASARKTSCAAELKMAEIHVYV